MQQQEASTKNGLGESQPNNLPVTKQLTGCPAEEDLAAWFEQRERRAESAFADHIRKCPRCANIIEQAASQESGAGNEEGFEDHDLLALQPGLRIPPPTESKKPQAAFIKSKTSKSKTPAAKIPATIWELLTGKPARKP